MIWNFSFWKHSRWKVRKESWSKKSTICNIKWNSGSRQWSALTANFTEKLLSLNNETTTGNIHQLLGSGLAEKLNQNLVKSLNLKTIVYRKTKGERSVLNNILGIHPLKSKIWMTQICIHYAQSHFFGKSKSYGKAQWHHTVNYFWPMKRTCTF